jgi:hypothetical protein
MFAIETYQSVFFPFIIPKDKNDREIKYIDIIRTDDNSERIAGFTLYF